MYSKKGVVDRYGAIEQIDVNKQALRLRDLPRAAGCEIVSRLGRAAAQELRAGRRGEGGRARAPLPGGENGAAKDSGTKERDGRAEEHGVRRGLYDSTGFVYGCTFPKNGIFHRLNKCCACIALE